MNILFNFKNLFVLAILLIVIGLSLNTKTWVAVEVKGAVEKPGVYKITDEMLVEDLLKLSKVNVDADTSQINLGKKVYDEMVIIVPTKEEINSLNINTAFKVIENECVCPKIINDSCISLEVPKDEIIKNNKVSLNHATKEELMKLSGIGEAKAVAIIEYRQNKNFESTEEIMNIKGIGKSIYEKIKDDISI